jgi:hypothetical protein
MALLLKSFAGSHLYGLSRPESDLDYYEVHTDSLAGGPGMQRKAFQTIVDGVDVTAVGFSHFADLAASGSHQALDAMFSQKTLVDKIEAFRASFRVSPATILPIYRGIIFKFVMQDTERKFKHAARLAYNLNDMMEFSRFNPTLTSERAAHVLSISKLDSDAFKEELHKVSTHLA